MSAPCSSCALTDGACANREPSNQLTALICVRAGIPFYCHEGQDWRAPGAMTRRILQRAKVATCAGWRREVAQLAETGYFKRAGRLKHVVGVRALEALRVFLDAPDGSFEKRNASDEMDNYLALLTEPGDSDREEVDAMADDDVKDEPQQDEPEPREDAPREAPAADKTEEGSGAGE